MAGSARVVGDLPTARLPHAPPRARGTRAQQAHGQAFPGREGLPAGHAAPRALGPRHAQATLAPLAYARAGHARAPCLRPVRTSTDMRPPDERRSLRQGAQAAFVVSAAGRRARLGRRRASAGTARDRARRQRWRAVPLHLAVAALLTVTGVCGGPTVDVGPHLANGTWSAVVANAAASSTIRFQAGTYRAGEGGCNVALPVNASLVSATPGEAVVIDCQGSGNRHFVVAAGSRSVIAGLTLANGSSQGDAGCVLVEAGASLEFRHSILTNCQASGSGGGVHVSEGSDVRVFESAFEECVADAEGGGVYLSQSSLVLERSSVRSCSADKGGAVYGSGSQVTVSGGTYEGNTAGASGGMAYVDQSLLVVTDASIVGCEAERGGAVYAMEGAAHVRRSTMRDNYARKHGGAMYGHTRAELIFSENTLLLRNEAGSDSGAVHLWRDATLYASNNVTFEENTADDDAGAISCQGATPDGAPVLKLEGKVVFVRNSAKDRGGAVFVIGRCFVEVIGDVEFVQNVALDDGGAISMERSSSSGDGTLSIEGAAVFRENEAKSYGGSLYLRDVEWTKIGGGVVFEKNHGNFAGGAIVVFSSALLVSDVHFVDNTASEYVGRGGCLFVDNTDAVEIARSTFSASRAATGGSIWSANSNLNITDNVVFTQSFAQVSGAAIWMEESSTAHIERDVTFSDNKAQDGGAMVVSGDPASHAYIARNVRFERNRAAIYDGRGGAIVVQGSSTLELSDMVLFSSNCAENGGAIAGLGHDGATIRAHSGVTFSGNRAVAKGGAVAVIPSESLDDDEQEFLIELWQGVLMEDNQAEEQGGAIFTRSQAGFIVHLRTQGDVHILGNRAERGGGIGASEGALVTLGAGARVRHNVARASGGGVRLSGRATLSVPGGDVGLIANNATSGAGLLVAHGSQAYLIGADIFSNVASLEGGDPLESDGCGAGILGGADSVIVLSGSRLQANVAASGGAAVCLTSSASFEARECEFQANSVIAGQGGAVKSTSTLPASFSECSFVRNSAHAGQGCAAVSCGSGGAVAVAGDAQVLLSDSRMLENYAGNVPDSTVSVVSRAWGKGGALLLENTAHATLRNVLLAQNRAAGDGGGISMSDDTRMALLGVVTLTGNRAKHLGGAMFLGSTATSVTTESTCTIEKLEAHENVAEEGSGGAIFSSRPITCIAGGRTRLHRNRAANEGGAIVLDEASLQLLEGHTLEAAYNSAGTNGGAVALLSGARISAEDRACAASCSVAKRGDGRCDPDCLNSACNWDDGDCARSRFETAGIDAQQSCRSSDSSKDECSATSQTGSCASSCFTASCDFNRQQCLQAKAEVAGCPILDAVVLNAIIQTDQPMSSLVGGTSQEYGWCLGECNHPEAPPRAADLTGPGRVSGTALALDGHGAWLYLKDLEAAMAHEASANFTVEVWTKVGSMSLFPDLNEHAQGNDLRGLPVGFILAGSNFAVAMLTDTDSRSTASAWPLVFAGQPPAAACYGQNVVLHASTGRIGDGPGMIPRDSDSECSWTIAPPGARSVTLLFTEFYLFKTEHQFRDQVEVCMCLDAACQSSGQCHRFSGGEVPPTLTSTTGVMLVTMSTSGLAYRTNPGFTAFYAAAYDQERLDQNAWHHLAVTVESNKQRAETVGADAIKPQDAASILRVYVDGSEVRNQSLVWDPLHAPAFDAAFGTAVGRGSPHWQHNPYPEYNETEESSVIFETFDWKTKWEEWQSLLDIGARLAVPSFILGRFNGSLDELRVWQEVRAAPDINAGQEHTCAEVQTPHLAACYSFEQHGETHFEDGSPGGRVQASTASGASPHLPWCQNAHDDSKLIHTCSDDCNTLFSPVSWGFCESKIRLPGSGFDYDRTAMLALALQLTAASPSLIERFPGCGSVPFNLSHNTAGAYGGAVYADSCRGQQRCFLDGTGASSGTRAGIFYNNRAGKGGGALFMACIAFSGACLDAFADSNTAGCLPSLPKNWFVGNVAAYGDDLASDPAHLRLLDAGDDLALVPGQQMLEIGADFVDFSYQRCREVEDVLQVLVCRDSDQCNKDTAVSGVTFYDVTPKTGLIAVAQNFACPMEGEAVGGESNERSSAIYATVRVSLVRFTNVQSQHVRVRCLWCRAGESRQVSADGKTWFCTKCETNQYVMDPNNVAHQCTPCPAQATCDGQSMTPQIGALGKHWQEDVVRGRYTLVGCPPAYSLDQSRDERVCALCTPGTYCTGGDTAPFACPDGSHSAPAAKAQKECWVASMVLLKVGMPFSHPQFIERERTVRQSIAEVADTAIDNVVILSVTQTASERRRWTSSHPLPLQGAQRVSGSGPSLVTRSDIITREQDNKVCVFVCVCAARACVSQDNEDVSIMSFVWIDGWMKGGRQEMSA